MTPIIAAALAFAAAQTQQDPQGATVVRQVRLPVDKVLGGKIEPSREERDAAKEARRHNKAMEKELRRLVKDNRHNPFMLGAKATRQPKTVRRLDPRSSSY